MEGNVLEFKDEGDFFTTKLTPEGKPIENGKLYVFGTLIEKTFYSKKECKAFAKKLGFTATFD